MTAQAPAWPPDLYQLERFAFALGYTVSHDPVVCFARLSKPSHRCTMCARFVEPGDDWLDHPRWLVRRGARRKPVQWALLAQPYPYCLTDVERAHAAALAAEHDVQWTVLPEAPYGNGTQGVLLVGHALDGR
jgi:hypothetical protein